MEGQYVVVTTEHRGVFGGRFVARQDREITLADARVCLYWSRETKGFIGLAVTGPLSGSRVSSAARRLIVTGVTSITLATEEAEKCWEEGPWS